MNKKEKLLKKYLEKKKKQMTRDELFKQITALSKEKDHSAAINLIKTKVKKRKKKKDGDSFEKKLFEDVRAATPPDYSPQGPADASSTSSHAGLEDSTRINDLDVRDGKILQDEFSEPVPREQGIHGAQKPAVDNKALIEESFTVQRCENRPEEIQEERKKLDIFFDEVEIVSQIKRNLVVFVQGETGCGKTTQIPQFLLENGFREKGLICVTQPRRLAAVSIASRINTELGESLCGYKIKYENSLTSETRIKVVTEGVLFREIQSDFLLGQYSVVVLDEVHERTTNMDILIGLLSKIVKLRHEQGSPLRLVLMSATADTEDFRGVLGDFPVIGLTNKKYKISVFYEDRTEENYLDAIYKKVLNILEAERPTKRSKRAGKGSVEMPTEIVNDASAGVLVFLPTKEDIYTLKARLECLDREITVLPLHSALSREEQSLVYRTYESRKIILSTNIAETSVTICGIVFVIDSGRAKHRIQDESCVKYQVSFISKSSARQRMGRAGRVGPGVCFRIYSGATFEAFHDRNVPQIHLEPFDGMLLQLKVCGIENVFSLPLASPLSREAVQDAVSSLQNLGALDKAGNVSYLGRCISRYFIPPRFARLLCTKHTDDIFYHLVVIACMLSLNFDVRKSENNREYFVDEKSDLVAYLKVYLAYEKDRNKRAFASKHGLSISTLQEITKLCRYLIKISGRPDVAESHEVSAEQSVKICKNLYYAFSDQVAVNSGASYIYKNGDLFVSRDSIDVASENIIFEHIICGQHKDYAKNITIIDRSWF